jgi:uracil-DNA glycosylase
MGRPPKYAKKVDLNQQEIIDALRACGYSVVVIGEPVDLLVGGRAHNWLFEVKRPGEKPRTKKQKEFLATWPGQVRVVETPEEAIRVVTRSYRRGGYNE